MSSQTNTEKRKVARIVFDRPPLKKLSFLLFSLAGLVVGLLVALLLHWLGFGLGDAASPDFPPAFITKECYQWYVAWGLMGLAGGIGLGWGWNRQVTARIEMVEQPTMARRRSTSTALVRVDYGRRW